MPNQPISVYLPVALKARVPEAVKHYKAKTPGKLFKWLLQRALVDMELAQADAKDKKAVDDRVPAVEQS